MVSPSFVNSSTRTGACGYERRGLILEAFTPVGMSGCALHLFRGAVIEILSDIVVRADRKSICLPADAASFLAWQVPEDFLRIRLAQDVSWCGIWHP